MKLIEFTKKSVFLAKDKFSLGKTSQCQKKNIFTEKRVLLIYLVNHVEIKFSNCFFECYLFVVLFLLSTYQSLTSTGTLPVP